MLTIGLEPILPKGTDFKSVVFTDFTKRAELKVEIPTKLKISFNNKGLKIEIPL